MKKWINASVALLLLGVVMFAICAAAPVAMNDRYAVYKDDDGYTLRFHNPPAREVLPEGMFVSYIMDLYFDSLAQMKEKFLTGDFSEKELLIISRWLDKNGEMELPDLDKLYEPVLPEGVTCAEVYWAGDYYSFHLASDQLDPEHTNWLSLVEKEDFEGAEESLRDSLRFYDVQETPMEDRNGTCYAYEIHSTRNQQLQIRKKQVLIYTLETDGKTMIVKEEYDVTDTEKHLEYVRFYGEENGIYFSGTLYGRQLNPVDQWLMSVGFRPYTES